MNKTKGIILALVSSGTFGLIAFFSIPLLRAGMHAPSILFYRSLLAAVFLAVICLIRKRNFRISPTQAALMLFQGFLYTMTAMGLIYSYSYISSGVATTIHFLYPVMVACMMIIFYKEKLSRSLFLAAIVALLGVALLCWNDEGVISTKGLLAVLLTVFTYSAYIVNLNRKKLKSIEPEVYMFYVMLFGAFIFSVFSHATTGIEMVPDAISWFNLIGFALFATVLSGLTLISAVRYAGSTIASILGSMEPVVATFVGVFHFGEPFAWNSFLGLALIVAAVTLVVIATSDEKDSKE